MTLPLDDVIVTFQGREMLLSQGFLDFELLDLELSILQQDSWEYHREFGIVPRECTVSRIYSSSLPDCTKQDLWEGKGMSTYQLVTNRYLGVSPFSEVSLIGTEGGRGIHNVFWIVLSSSGSFFLSGVH